MAGPYKPQDRIFLSDVKSSFEEEFKAKAEDNLKVTVVNRDDVSLKESLSNGSVVIAAITSCTNTSNPSVMIGAGLAAKKAVEKGLKVPFFVKTSLSPRLQGGCRLSD